MLTIVEGTHINMPKLNRYWSWVLYMEDGDLYIEAAWNPNGSSEPRTGGSARRTVGHSPDGDISTLADCVEANAKVLASHHWSPAFPATDEKFWALRKLMVQE